jgi:hypothetical protein
MILSLRAAVFLLAAAASGFAQPGVFAGGGVHVPRLDGASDESDKGWRGVAGFQLAGDNLAIVLQGGYAGYASRGSRPADSALRETRILEAHVLPKFYLRRGDIAAYFIGGGGPQWISQEVRAGGGGAAASGTQLDFGFQAGFGVEALVSNALKVGIAPSYHAVYWNGRQEFEYASLVVYLML